MNFARFVELILLATLGFVIGMNQSFWGLIFPALLAGWFARINMDAPW